MKMDYIVYANIIVFVIVFVGIIYLRIKLMKRK